MKHLVWILVVVGMAGTVSAQSIPAGWTVTKDESGTCQVAHPADWKPGIVAGMTNDPGNQLRATVLWERDAKVEVHDAATQKILGVKVAIENTAQRNFTENAPVKVGPGPYPRVFEVLVPARPKGACQVMLNLYPGGSEELMKKVALTLAPAK